MTSKTKILALNNFSVDNFVVVEESNSLKFKIKEFGNLKIELKSNSNNNKHLIVLTTADGSFESQELETTAVISHLGLSTADFSTSFLKNLEGNDGEIKFYSIDNAFLSVVFAIKGKEVNYLISTEETIDLSALDANVKVAFQALENKFSTKLNDLEKKIELLTTLLQSGSSGQKGNSTNNANNSQVAEKQDDVKVVSTFTLENAKNFKTIDKIKVEREQNYYCYPVYAEIDDKLYAVGINKWIEIREKGSNDVIHAWEAHKEAITAILYHSNFLISGSKDYSVIVWDATTYKKVRAYKEEKEILFLCKFSNDLFASANKIITLYNPNQDAPIKKLEGHTDYITALFLSSNEDTLVSTSYDRTIRLWSTKTKKAIDCFTAKSNITSACALEGDLIVAADDNVNVWNLKNKAIEFQVDTVSGVRFIRAFAYVGNKFFIGGGEPREMYVWNYEENKLIASYKGHENEITKIVRMKDGTIFSSDKSSYMLEWS